MRSQSSHLSNGIRTHRYPLRDCHARADTEVLRANVRAPFQLRKGADVLITHRGNYLSGIASMAARFAARSPNGFGGRSEPNSVVSTAMSLNVKGFLDIALFMTEDRQLSIALNAFEASNGEIVYSKIITGEPAKSEHYLHVYLAKMQVGITHSSTGNTPITHSAMQLGVEAMMRLTSSWTFSGGGSVFSDDNTNLTTKYEKSINGITLDGIVGYDLFGFGGNQADVSINGGLGMIFAAALNSPMYVKGGLNLTVAEQLTLGFNYLNMLSSNDDTFKMPNMTNITLGWKF